MLECVCANSGKNIIFFFFVDTKAAQTDII